MKRLITVIGLICFLGVSQGNIFAQVTEARVVPVTDSILIGDQPEISVEMQLMEGSKVRWPEFPGDTVVSGIEILERGPVDTSYHDNGYMTLSQSIKVTSFDSGLYVIKPIRFDFILPDDTAVYSTQSQPAFLTVMNPEVDMQGDIKPIKPPLEAPLTFAEILPWLLGALALIAAVIIVVYVIRRSKKEGPVLKIRSKPSVPAHVQVLDELEKLRLRKLWQSGKVKEYYTQLTEIIRWYIEERYKIMALEMTTDEIASGLKSKETNTEIVSRLIDTLGLADLVKFAKEEPMPVENDISLNNCIDFVNETKPQPEPAEEKSKEEIKEEV